MSEALFDLTDEYEQMLNQGIRLSGESMLFFMEGRLQLLRQRTHNRLPVRRVLDFGCGLGYTSKRLRDIFPQAEVTGADTSENAIRAAEERHGSPEIQFRTVADLPVQSGHYDLCYVNGVFHHIAPDERLEALGLIHRVLAPHGVLALFDNNPWNPGARMVMSRIPFDRDAQMLSPLAARALLREAGFKIVNTDSLFFFPHALKPLRFAEPLLGPTWLGAQYLVLGQKS